MISAKNIHSQLTSPRWRLHMPYSDIEMEAWQWLLAILVGLICAALPGTLALALFLAIPIGLAIINNPLNGLVLAMFLGPLGAWEKVFVGGPIAAVTSGQLVLLATIASWLARGLKRGRIYLPHTPLNVPLLIFIAFGGLSLWWAEDIMGGIRELLKWIEMLFVIWMILDLTRDYEPKRVVKGLIILLLAAGFVQACWGVWQFAIRGTGPGHFIIFGRFYRGTGSFQQPNPFGGFMGMIGCLSVGVSVGLFGRYFKTNAFTPGNILDVFRSQQIIRLSVAISALIITALFGSWSRGAWLSFAFAMAIFTIFIARNRVLGFLQVVGSGILFFIVLKLGILPGALAERLTGFLEYFSLDALRSVAVTGVNPNNHAVLERLAHWAAALNMAADHLWTGVGLGNYEVVYLDYNVLYWNEPLGHAHNYYLNMLAEGGIWGLIVYIGLWVAIFAQTIRATNNPDPLERGAAVGLLAAWSGISLHHLLDNLYVNNLFIPIAVMLTLVIMLQLSASEAKRAAHQAAAEEGNRELNRYRNQQL